MNAHGEFHPEVFCVLPAILVQCARCECCDEDSGFVVSLVWLCFSLHLVFGGKEPHA